MPVYHFNLADGGFDADAQGMDLPDVEAARLMAVRHAGELLCDEPETLWKKGQWRVEVTDDCGVLLHTVILLAIDAPTPERQSGRTAAQAGEAD